MVFGVDAFLIRAAINGEVEGRTGRQEPLDLAQGCGPFGKGQMQQAVEAVGGMEGSCLKRQRQGIGGQRGDTFGLGDGGVGESEIAGSDVESGGSKESRVLACAAADFDQA